MNGPARPELTRARQRWLAGLLLAGALPAQADTLIAANGDRLTGSLVSRDDKRIVFQSDLFGRIELDSDKARVETTTPAGATTAGATAAKPSSPGWHADLGVKLALDRGSLKTTENDLDVSLDYVRKAEHGELHADLDYDYKRTAGELKDDDWSGSLSYDKFLDRQRFAAGRFLATTDLTSEGYDRTLALSAAYGWRLWERDDHYLRLGPAVGYLSITRGAERFNGPALGLYARAKGPVRHRASFGGELQFLDSLGQGRYANLEFRLRQPLGERLYLALVWKYAWSDFDIESGVKSEWRWDLGWRFGPGESE